MYSPSDFLYQTSGFPFCRIEMRWAFVSTPDSVPFFTSPSSPWIVPSEFWNTRSAEVLTATTLMAFAEFFTGPDVLPVLAS
ncbi:hypothetical protein C5C40_09795 [Rathayibacter rathayi]|uniref:Uncharacterized protein n=1 Tax=Rathayibacter rathayi TaxID=33887 RepID=A0ABD6W6A1_RATRA|nr:hypothetical protein C5C04_11625 [Rathayibacter rathayi]PPH76043.1 hypothetical protein C5C40_09795 [Rathayibacter rathayi]